METDIVRTSVGVPMIYFKNKPHIPQKKKTPKNLNIIGMVGVRLRVHSVYITRMGQGVPN